jgi:FdrA protein
VPAIRDARLAAAKEGRALAVVAFVCGTEDDPQRRSVQEQKLRDAGASVYAGSTAAVFAAARLVGPAR